MNSYFSAKGARRGLLLALLFLTVWATWAINLASRHDSMVLENTGHDHLRIYTRTN